MVKSLHKCRFKGDKMINLPEKFEEFSDTKRQWFIKVKELKD